ncbi:HEAT repeat domain-containing protein [Myxococcota bacterium]|nr:HEAT repeat domain-containing protein [Myxococcota bacterium]
MRTRFGFLLGGVGLIGSALLLSACGGIEDCKTDGAKCAAMLNANGDKCAVAFALTQSDPKRKACENAVKVVEGNKMKEAVPGLIAILNAPETNGSTDDHRQEAARALGRIGDPAAIDPLIAAIDFGAGTSEQRDKNANRTNEEIATALGALKAKAAVPKLIELIDKSRHNYAQLKAIRALGDIGDAAAIEPLSKIALEHENKFIRKNAVEALGEIGDLKATDTLIQMMFIEFQGVSFYKEASFSLFQLGPGVADALLDTMAGKNEKVNKYFEKTGGLKDTAIKAKCGFVLGDLRDARATKPLLEAFEAAVKDKDAVVLVYSAAPLGALGDSAAVKPLAEQMVDLDASKRDPIMRALVQLGDRSVVATMIDAMTPKHFLETCVKLKYGSKEECAAEDNKPSLEAAQKAAAEHASNLAGPEHAEAYKKVAEAETNAAIKDHMMKRMPRIDAAVECKADATCWAGKLKSPDPLLREKAAWELGRIKDKSTIPALTEALGDQKPQARSAAIMAYFNYGDASAIPAIEKRLEDEASSADFIRVNEDLKRLLVHLRRLK